MLCWKKKALTLASELRTLHQDDKAMMKLLSGLHVRLDPDQTTCLICGKPLNLLKTDHKTCYSFGLGKFKLITASSYCSDHKHFDGKSGQIIRYESSLAALLVEKGYRITFDLVVKVGRLRYEEHRQLREIQSYLKCSPAKLDLPVSTISIVAGRFLEFCRLLHESRTAEIKDALAASGGYFLHFDGSTEQKSGKCSLTLVDSRSGLILVSQMVESEKCDTIIEALKKAKEKFGLPLAVISDLRAGFVEACIAVFGDQAIHILCHYHFLRTFVDEFKSPHNLIGTCMTKKWQLQARLKKQLKDLKDVEFHSEYPKMLKTIERIEAYWQDTDDTLGAYRYVLQWILSYKQDSTGKSVPFDLPFLDLYHRFIAGKDLIDKIFVETSAKNRQKYYRHGFCGIIEGTKHLGHQESGFRKALHLLEYQRKWFNKLRAVLFMEAQIAEDRSLAPLSKTYRLTLEEARQLPLRIKGFLISLKRELAKCKHPARRTFLEKIVKQLEKYKDQLSVPILAVTIDGEEALIMPPRVNNFLESLFRSVKSLLRRCTGRSKLPREFNHVGAELPYFQTMKSHSIFKDIFADDRRLAEEFAKLFIKQWQPPANLIALPKKSTNVAGKRQKTVLEA
jgi:hypothetical protein